MRGEYRNRVLERMWEKGREKIRNEESNERAEGLVIRRKERYCKEEKDGGRKDKKRVQE